VTTEEKSKLPLRLVLLSSFNGGSQALMVASSIGTCNTFPVTKVKGVEWVE
jgi:hypothetical protein